MSKKLLSLMLAVLMSLSLVMVACGGDDEAEETSSSSSSSSSSIESLYSKSKFSSGIGIRFSSSILLTSS